MKHNSRLYLALHTLGHMASEPDRVRTSAEIAQHAGTNPVVVRRVLGRLRAAGLLTSEKGHAGGWKLAHMPQSISLADVYIALDENLVASGQGSHASDCSVEQALHHRVSTLLDEAEQRFIDRLAEVSIVDVASSKP